MSFSLSSFVESGVSNIAYIFVNGEQVFESKHFTYSESGWVSSTGGREVFLEANAGDSITLRTTGMGGYFQYVMTCIDFVPPM